MNELDIKDFEYWYQYYTMREMAVITGVSIDSVSRWKKGDLPPMAGRLLLLYHGELTMDVWEDQITNKLEEIRAKGVIALQKKRAETRAGTILHGR
jgi:transcriptional regulator with XRE-family HTH domain